MSAPENVILFNGTKPTKPVLKFIQKQIEKWFSQNQDLLNPADQYSYQITVERQSGLSFTCSVRVQNDSLMWEGYASGKTIQEAFPQALKHMRATTMVDAPESADLGFVKEVA